MSLDRQRRQRSSADEAGSIGHSSFALQVGARYVGEVPQLRLLLSLVIAVVEAPGAYVEVADMELEPLVTCCKGGMALLIVQSSGATQPQTVRTRGLAVILFPAEDGSVEDVIHNAMEHCSDVDGHTLSVTSGLLADGSPDAPFRAG